MAKAPKEFLYVGHYITADDKYILKIGTTDNPKRRAKEHTRNYAKAKNFTLKQGEEFTYDRLFPLAKYNTLRYEDLNRDLLRERNVGEFIRNDRFLCEDKPDFIEITIKKTYLVAL